MTTSYITTNEILTRGQLQDVGSERTNTGGKMSIAEQNLLCLGKLETPVGKHISGKIFVGEISIKTHLKDAENKPVFFNLQGYYGEISIEESVFSSAIHGSIKVNDTSGFIERYRICGGESLTIILLNQNAEPIVARTDLIIHSIVEGPVDNITLATSYIFHFTSRIFLISSKTRLYKSFKNKNILNIVHEIYNGILQDDFLKDLESIERPTRINAFIGSGNDVTIKKEKPFISTGYTPFKAIEYLTKRLSGASNNKKFYMFFERLIATTSEITIRTTTRSLLPGGKTETKDTVYSSKHTHHLLSFEDINSTSIFLETKTNDSKNPGIHTIVYNPSIQGNIENPNDDKTLYNVLRTNKIEKITSFNHLDAMLTGFYNLRVTTVDPIKKNSSSIDVKYNDLGSADFYNNPLLAKDTIFEKYKGINENTQVPGEKLVFGTPIATNDPSQNFNAEQIQKFDWLPTHIKGQVSKNIFKLKVTIEGSTNKISAGNIVQLKIPSHEAKTTLQDRDNQIYSGKYFVTDVKHMIVGNDYLKEVTLARGSSLTNLLTGTASGVSQPTSSTPSTQGNASTGFSISLMQSEIPIVEIINSYLDNISIQQDMVTITRGNLKITRPIKGGIGAPIPTSLTLIKTLGIEFVNSDYTDNSYRVIAQLIKQGTFKTFGDAYIFFLPLVLQNGTTYTNINVYSEQRTVANKIGLYLKESIINKFKAYLN